MITINQKNIGSGGLYIIKAAIGEDLEAFEKLVTDTYNNIDRYRSPSIMRYLDASGGNVAEIKYYGLD